MFYFQNIEINLSIMLKFKNYFFNKKSGSEYLFSLIRIKIKIYGKNS